MLITMIITIIAGIILASILELKTHKLDLFSEEWTVDDFGKKF